MLLAGDETGPHPGRQQQRLLPGQRNQLDVLDRETEDRELMSFVGELINSASPIPVSAGRSFFQGPRVKGTGVKDNRVADSRWSRDDRRDGVSPTRDASAFTCRATPTNEDDDRGRPVIDDDFIVLLNSHHEAIRFLLPRLGERDAWQVVLDTARANGDALYQGAEQFPRFKARSLALLTRVKIGAVRGQDGGRGQAGSLGGEPGGALAPCASRKR